MINFAVIDTETNWNDEVMSIGMIISNTDTFGIMDFRYYIIKPEYKVGGMFSDTLFFKEKKLNVECSRKKAISELKNCFEKNQVIDIFAYNASFDYRHLPELSCFNWYDIIRVAAYRQYNNKIPQDADFYGTGRLRSGYGVEPMLKMLSGDETYYERHNALTDARDELRIMQMIDHNPSDYLKLQA